jgi:hypothetical protein
MYGIIGSLIFGGHEKSSIYLLTFFIISTAWICHFLMSLQWILGNNISLLLIKIGTFSGVTSFLIPPISNLADNSILDYLRFVGLEIFSVFPCLLLIIFIIIKQFNKNKLASI